MGCNSSTSAAVTNDIKEQSTDVITDEPIGTAIDSADTAPSEIPQRQRRRLSVTGEHVGDITEEVEAPHAALSRRFSVLTSEHVQSKSLFKDPLDQSEHPMYAVVTKKGFVPYNMKKVNQDAFFCKTHLKGNPRNFLFGVCDGHGEYGHDVAQYVAKNLPDYLDKLDYVTDPRGALLEVVARVHGELSQDMCEINTTFSGTTLVFSLFIDDRVYTANLGDSRGVVFQKQSCHSLSFDQKPDNKGEKERILEAGGRVEPLPGPPNTDTGPDRVWLKEVDVPGLAMSRSLGDDVAHSVGVSAIPEIIEHTIGDADVFAVWASDGVWEFLSNEDVQAVIFANYESVSKSCLELVDRSIEEWKKEEEVIDDITAVVLDIQAMRKSELCVTEE
jgi:serine/threonine protein phosphatase PrpC